MKKTVFILLLFVAVTSVYSRDFDSKGDALKAVMASEDKLFREEIILTKAVAKELNKKYDTDYKKNEKFTIYYTKNEAGEISSYSIVLVDILWKYLAQHEWAIGFNPDGSIRGIRIIMLTDEYTFDMPDPRFLSQFDGLLPADIQMPGNVDAVTGATMSSELLVGSVIKAWEMIQMLN